MRHKPFEVKTGQKAGLRPVRFAQRVREELSDLLPSSIKDPRLHGIALITITSVTVTPDLKHGTVMFALMGQEARAQEVEEGLNQASGFLRKELMYRLSTKITPQLTFRYDYGLDHSSKISELLKEAAEKK